LNPLRVDNLTIENVAGERDISGVPVDRAGRAAVVSRALASRWRRSLASRRK